MILTYKAGNKHFVPKLNLSVFEKSQHGTAGNFNLKSGQKGCHVTIFLRFVSNSATILV